METIYLIVGNIILGFFVRYIIISMSIMLVRSGVKDKKKRSKIKLEIKDQNTKVFIGGVGVLSFLYMLSADIYKGYLDDFNSLVWLGMFLPEIIMMFQKIHKKVEAKKIAEAKKKEEEKKKQDKLLQKQNGINEKNAYHLNNMLRSIK